MGNGKPIVTVAFRYRDLIAHTLQEHEKIIQQSGGCFWGWWKRPTERRREEIWEHLEQRITAEGTVPVALFDSGAPNPEKRVHVAWVTEVRPPSGDGGSVPTVQLSDADREQVPPYYRGSIFSRAWLRIVKIEENALEFFGAYSYLEPPPLPGIAQQDLDRLKGKVIVDRDELRAMDTTIWRVRDRQPADNSDRFLSSSIRLAHAVSAQPVRLRGSKILHLSDLHFATGSARGEHFWAYPTDDTNKPTFVQALTRSLESQGIQNDIGVVLITGDFTYIASPTEFDVAHEQLAALQGALDLGSDTFVLIPGNHDVQWTQGDARYSAGAPVTRTPSEATQAYRVFYKTLMGHDADDDLCMGRRFLFPNGIVVDLCALNSSSLAQGRNFLAGMGQVPNGALDRIGLKLGWNRAGASLRLLALHHHLVPTEDLEDPGEYSSGFGMANDAQNTLRRAVQQGVSLVLHGHRHRPFVWRSAVYQLPDKVKDRWELGEVSILGCGSTGSTALPKGASNYFNILTPEHHRLVLEFFQASADGAFEPMSRWTASLCVTQADGLRAGPWTVEPSRN